MHPRVQFRTASLGSAGYSAHESSIPASHRPQPVVAFGHVTNSDDYTEIVRRCHRRAYISGEPDDGCPESRWWAPACVIARGVAARPVILLGHALRNQTWQLIRSRSPLKGGSSCEGGCAACHRARCYDGFPQKQHEQHQW
jgi:hypothetical protein